MPKDDRSKQILAGLFFISGCVLICFVIFFIGFNRGLSRPQFAVEVLFDKVGGLAEGAPVRLSGVAVGTVRSIDLLDQDVTGRGIRVTLGIYRRYEKQLIRSTSISIQTEGVLGAKYVEIDRRPGESLLDISRPVLAEPLLDVYDIANVLESTAGSFNETTRGINLMMGELQGISRKTKRLLDRIERRVMDGNLFKIF